MPPKKQPPPKLHTLASVPKSWRFPKALPADPQFATPMASHATARDAIEPRLVRGALFTYVRPEEQEDPEVLAVSRAALRDLGLREDEATSETLRQTAAGNHSLWGDMERGEYPWAQCYGGFQFGQWAGQLGDGRAISLFEVPAPDESGGDANDAEGEGPQTYEIQLKGAGVTPYSRFADGRAVLRSSLREFVASEALHALGIPTTRALALTLLPKVLVHRETLEPGAIVVRFARSWLRLGTFDLLRARGDRVLTKRLADYVLQNVLPTPPPPARSADENLYARLFRAVARRNARTVAWWQAYGFVNGVLNTDNTSVLGLSMDFGPFAFLDVFDPQYTPNHDDHLLRYSYSAQPSVIWWNLVRFGEAIGELIAAGDRVEDPAFVDGGFAALGSEDDADVAAAAAEAIIMRTQDEYQYVLLTEYNRLFAARLGLAFDPPTTAPSSSSTFTSNDTNSNTNPPAPEPDPLVVDLLSMLAELELDFHLFFRRLSDFRLADIATDEARTAIASRFFYREGLAPTVSVSEDDARKQIAAWLARWRDRVLQAQNGDPVDDPRIRAMKAVNPNFVPRGWILDEVIRRVDKEGDRDVLRRIMHMALHPFADSWSGQTFDGNPYKGDPDEEIRWTQDVSRKDRAMQCSCSS